MKNFIKMNRALAAKKKLFTFFLALVTSVGTLFAASGTCDENLTWDLTGGILTISGTGEMNDYDDYDPHAPWYSSRSSITSMIINDGVTSIGNNAFYGCEKLTSVTIPNSVTNIGENAFYNCKSLTSITIPNSVTSIEKNAFYGCSSLPVIDNLRYADTYLVEAVTQTLATYTIKNGTKWIGTSAFYSCSSLTSINIPNSVTSIGRLAFGGCTSLTSIEIPNSVTSIGDGAFDDCIGLTSIAIPNSVTSIGVKAFYNCTGLTSVEIPNSVTSIEKNAFSGCTSLTSVTLLSNAIVSQTYSSDFNLRRIFGAQIKEYIIGEEVTSIGGFAFSGCSNLTSVTIPNSVTSIGENAFEACGKLQAVYVPCGEMERFQELLLKNQGNSDAYNNLMYLPFPFTITAKQIEHGKISIPQYASCDKQVEITAVPDRGYQFMNWADGNTDNPRTIELTQDTVMEAVFDYASTGQCGKDNMLTWTYDLATKALNISGEGELSDNYTYGDFMESVTIGNGVTSIGSSAFYGCSSLTSIEIPNSITSIGENAFEACGKLQAVYVPCGEMERFQELLLKNQGNSDAYNNLMYLPSPFTITAKQIEHGKISIPKYTSCDKQVEITAVPNRGYQFMNWADGNTDNPRTIELTQDTVMEAVFDYASTGKCGKDNMLTWTFDLATKALNISGEGELSDNYTYGDFMESVTIGNAVTSIGEKAFYNCTGLTSVTLGNGITSIGGKVFEGCNNIQTVVWKLKTYSDFTSSTKPFSASVTSFTFSEDVEYIPAYLCYNMNKLGSISIGENVSGIGNSAFYGCTAIKTVVWEAKNIPDFTSSNKPFSSSITSITFGDEVEHIPAYLCNGLGKQLAVAIKAMTPPTLGNNVFSSSPAHIYVPCGSIDAYKAATNWSTYASAIKYEPLPFKISITPSDSGQVIKPTTVCDEMALTVNPNNGYVFAHWSDGNTDNPRTIELTQDTTFTALYSVAKSGTCGDDLALTWEYDDENKTLSISGNGALTKNYTYGLEAPENMTKLVLGEGITSIGNYAFSGCSNLQSVEWNVKNCADLNYLPSPFANTVTSITFGNEVEHIPARLCKDLNKLETVTIGNSVTGIGDYAFYGCSSLTSVTIGNSVTSIGYYAFKDCIGLTSVTLLSDAVVSKAYSSDSNISTIFGEQVKEYIIGGDVTSIGEYAFSKCTGMTSVTIGNNVTSIGKCAFSGCAGLTSIDIPNSVTSIGDYAFYGCTGLTSIEIPNNVTSIGKYTFRGCTALTSVTIGNSVTGIGDYAFYGCSSLTSVTIGNSVTSIGICAFNGCNIKEIHFAGTIEEWLNKTWSPHHLSTSYDLFVQNNKITDVSIPNNVTSIGDSAFYNCSSLTSVTIPESVENIGEMAFYNCIGLTSVILPNSVTSIGAGAFFKCTGLPSPIYNAHVFAFLPTTYSGAYTIPDGIESIAGGAFIECTGLTSIDIPNSITSIGVGAFNSCIGLTSVSIPNNVTRIEQATFFGCTGLTSVTIPNSVTCIGDYAFHQCTGLTSVTIPNSVTSIGNWAFTYCTGLTSVTIGNSVTSIGEYAFYVCEKLETVILGTGVEEIGFGAFGDCIWLLDIYCYAKTIPTISEKTFYNVSRKAYVWVPSDMVRRYEIAQYWGEFAIKPIGAASTQTNDLQITPANNTATVTWPSVDNAASYELVIKDKNGNVVCTLIFNAQGQLTSIAFQAPSRDGAPQHTQAAGFSFTVTGLDSGTGYDLTMTSKDATGQVIEEKTVSFATEGDSPTGVENVQSDNVQSTKVLRNGQIFILRGDKTYTLQGQEVK